MSEKAKFEGQFIEEEIELIILLKESCGGAGVHGDWLSPSVRFVASVNCNTGEFLKREGRLTWMIKNQKNRIGWGYDFEQYGIYRVLVRKSIPIELSTYQSEIMNNRYMLVKVLEENEQNENLQKLKEYLQKPVTIVNEMGSFTLNRQFSWFECTIDWNGESVSVCLGTDDNCDETAEVAMKTLLRYAEDKAAFDQRNREFAAGELLELANDWLEDDDNEDKPDEITKEMFMERMAMSDLAINSDGSITLYYSDGEMFWGHAIEVDIDAAGEYESADMVG